MFRSKLRFLKVPLLSSLFHVNYLRLIWFLARLWLTLTLFFVLYYEHIDQESVSAKDKSIPKDILQTFRDFMVDWCRIRRARIDVQSVLESCKDDLSWNNISVPERSLINRTDARNSEISIIDIQPAGEFSRFFIRSRTSDGRVKVTGGDFWRILLRGPATISPTVFDHGNGSYEVLFLVVEAGVYTLDITLDYSLCDGYRDPPEDWFIIGESVTGLVENCLFPKCNLFISTSSLRHTYLLHISYISLIFAFFLLQMSAIWRVSDWPTALKRG